MSASNPRAIAGPRRKGLFAAVLSAGLLTGLLACGGGGHPNDVVLPPGGVAIGNLYCSGAAEPPTNMVAHGQSITIRFVLTDANVQLPGANLPVSFDVVGGTLLNPPTTTDANGVVLVTFVASDPNFVGAGRVRLIGPTNARLDCDVSFTVFEPAITLTAETLDGNDAVVKPFDACGTTEFSVERQVVRKIRYRLVRIDPATNVATPVVGYDIHLTATGLTWTEMTVGPTDANGEYTVTITPFATGEGVATVTAEAVRPDQDGPNNTPDSVPDTLPSNTCTIGFNIINPICDNDGGSATVTYRSAFGVAKAAPLRPGESADVTASFVVDGVPQANRSIVVDAADGYVNGSSAPVHVMTNGAGSVTVTYTARNGFQGTDVVTFQDDVGTIQCTQTADISVVTCDINLEFLGPVCSGCSTPTIVHVTNVDPATASGETVALDVVGGGFTAQPPTGVLAPDGLGGVSVPTTLNVTPGFHGPATLSLSFISGYSCDSVTESFNVP